MITLPDISASYCRENCKAILINDALAKHKLLSRDTADSKRHEVRTSLNMVNGMAGHFVYPPGGGIDWHDDARYPGWRVYVSWSETGESGMIFEEGGVRRVCQDKPGWNVRQFLAPTWHCVWTECWRYSMGLYLPCTP
jgi:hypothetical protein